MIEVAYLNPQLIFQKASELARSTKVISLDSYFDERENPLLGLGMPHQSYNVYSQIMVPPHSFAVVTDGDYYGFAAQIVTRHLFRAESDITAAMFLTGKEKAASEKSGFLGMLKSIMSPAKRNKEGVAVTPFRKAYKTKYKGNNWYSGKEIDFSSEETSRPGFLISLGADGINELLLKRLSATPSRLKDHIEYTHKLEGMQDYGLSGDLDYAISREGGAPFLNLAKAKADLVALLEKSAVFRFMDGGEDAFYKRMIEFGSRLEAAINAVIKTKRGKVDGYHIFQIDSEHLTKDELKAAEGRTYSLAAFEGKHFLLPSASKPIGEKAEAPKPPKVKAGVVFKPVSGEGDRAEVVASPFKVNIEKSGEGVFGYTPRDIHKFLDKYVVGQEEAKKRIAVAAFQHMTRIHDALSDRKSKKSNILMMGDTGTGKTHIAKTLAKALELPFVEIDCNTLTEHGYEGSKIEDALVKLYDASGKRLDYAQRGIVFLDEFDKLRKQDERGRDVRGNVQNALLKVVEGDKVDLSKHGCKVELDTSDILFICGGAFAGSGSTTGLDEIVANRLSPEEKKRMGFTCQGGEEQKPRIDMEKVYMHTSAEDIIAFGIIPELVGRLTNYVALERLNIQTLRRILTEPKDSILGDQIAFFKTHGVELEFSEDALNSIAQRAYETGTGARSLKKIIDNVMLDSVYNINEYRGKKLVIDAAKIKKVVG